MAPHLSKSLRIVSLWTIKSVTITDKLDLYSTDEHGGLSPKKKKKKKKKKTNNNNNSNSNSNYGVHHTVGA